MNKEWKDFEDNVIVSRIGMDYLLFTAVTFSFDI